MNATSCAAVDPASRMWYPLMEMGCQPGSSASQYANMSIATRREGRGGKMYVPRAAYSLRMSFCTVPASLRGSTPCRFATAT